ncbi:hypothetical protein [Streptomyces sp. SID1121]|uniref:hypothetical protein n=1 Tax=Streptomyces sp. SID1121 TaxID=3425888 RepID=UPI0040572D35
MEKQPQFLVHAYITITRDPRTQYVVAIGGDERAAGILQMYGGFVSVPGPHLPYHLQPHTLPVDEQQRDATAASYALLLAGFSVFLDPSLNTLTTTPGVERQAFYHYLDQLTERGRHATDDSEVADVLTAIAAPQQGVLSPLVDMLLSTGMAWRERLGGDGQDPVLAEQLMDIGSTASNLSLQIQRIRGQAAMTSSPAQSRPEKDLPTPPAQPTAPSSSPRR